MLVVVGSFQSLPVATAVAGKATKGVSEGRNPAAAAAAEAEGLLLPLSYDCEGEVWVAGPGLAAGYLVNAASSSSGQQQQRFQKLWLQMPPCSQDHQQQQVSVAAGSGCVLDQCRSQPWTWFRTGDLGRMDHDGKRSGPTNLTSTRIIHWHTVTYVGTVDLVLRTLLYTAEAEDVNIHVIDTVLAAHLVCCLCCSQVPYTSWADQTIRPRYQVSG